jgi:alginate O-acetyltransferase complex protein AlgI
MLFHSAAFLAFFGVYLGSHLITPRDYRVYLVIVGSTIFYGWWLWGYVWLPYLLLMIAYAGAIWIAGVELPAARRRRLAATLVTLFLPLLVFKYADFLHRDVLGPLLGRDGNILGLPLPLGVSVVTFTLTAYVVDVYRGTFPADRSLPKVAGYALFFPHLIAGPILRPADLIPQLAHPRVALHAPFALGILIFTIGLVKKLLFADQIAAVVDPVYAQAGAPSAPAALLAILGFSVQIYCDFSGYIDMAVGIALIIGVRLPGNFLKPYASTSPVAFWRRWNISLSFWLRDYLYIPLGGNRRGRSRAALNIMITMLLGGLWHGANWTFVVWGLLHGAGIVLVHGVRWMLGDRLFRVPGWLSVVLTFLFVTLLWVFFRAPSLGKAGQVLAAPFLGDWTGATDYLSSHLGALALLAIFLALHRYDDRRYLRLALRRIRAEILWPAVALLWVLAIAAGLGGSAKFIYFDF